MHIISQEVFIDRYLQYGYSSSKKFDNIDNIWYTMHVSDKERE